MLKSFTLVFIFTNLFIILNTIGDAINFYRVFRWYKNMKLWHTLKYGWLFCAVAVGYLLNDLIEATYQIKGCHTCSIWYVLFFLGWFIMLRAILHETLMAKWRKEK